MTKIIRSRAPLRISFAGGGTDVEPYPSMKGGAVISTTIDRYAYVSLIITEKKQVNVRSQDYGLLETFNDISEMSYNGKLDLVKAAIKNFNFKNVSFDAVLHVDAPPGSGLGASSAVTVSLIGSLSSLTGIELSRHEIADKAYQIERIELGIKGGKQDQYSAAFGGFNLLEFTKNGVNVTPLKIKKEILNELLASLLVCDTRVQRLSGKIIERQAKSYSQGEKSVIENLDHIKQSTFEMKNALTQGNMAKICELLHDGWEHKKILDSKISNPELDKIYDSALKNGANGGKLLGAGGGGHFMFLCDPDKKEDVARVVEKLGCKVIRVNFDTDGLQVWKNNDSQVS